MSPSVPDDLVQVDGLSFSYDSRTILSHLNMRFPRGKVVAIMGGSGCGKTTLLKLIGGMLRPTSGSIRMQGRTLDTRDKGLLYELRRDIGMLFQFGALFTDLTVFDNVAFPCVSTPTCLSR